ncbi:MAG: hypothetical protein ABIY50_13400 [Ignavibacteria bacterium]
MPKPKNSRKNHIQNLTNFNKDNSVLDSNSIIEDIPKINHFSNNNSKYSIGNSADIDNTENEESSEDEVLVGKVIIISNNPNSDDDDEIELDKFNMSNKKHC